MLLRCKLLYPPLLNFSLTCCCMFRADLDAISPHCIWMCHQCQSRLGDITPSCYPGYLRDRVFRSALFFTKLVAHAMFAIIPLTFMLTPSGLELVPNSLENYASLLSLKRDIIPKIYIRSMSTLCSCVKG